MNESKSMVAIALLVIALGVAWLLNTLNVIPGIDWIWTGGLGIAGILVLMMSGIDRVSVVVGPFLVVTSVLSVLRQTGRLRFDIELPILAIVFGVLSCLPWFCPCLSHPFSTAMSKIRTSLHSDL